MSSKMSCFAKLLAGLCKDGMIKLWSYGRFFVKIVIIRMSLSNVNVQGWRSTYGCRCFCLLCYEKKKTEKHCVDFEKNWFVASLEARDWTAGCCSFLAWKGAGREGRWVYSNQHLQIKAATINFRTLGKITITTTWDYSCCLKDY